MTNYGGKKCRHLSHDTDLISQPSDTIEDDKISVRTLPYSVLKSHRKLLFIPPGKYINKYSSDKFSGVNTHFSPTPGTKSGYFSTTISKMV